MQSNGDKNHSSNLVLCGKFIHEFDIQSHEFESSIVRLDNAFFKLTNVRLKEKLRENFPERRKPKKSDNKKVKTRENNAS
jgi:hypothetical protein